MQRGTGGDADQQALLGGGAAGDLDGRLGVDVDDLVVDVVSRISGTKFAPMPWILCGPGAPPLRIGDSAGSTPTIWMFGLRSLSTWPTPVMVPPVPMPATKMSTLPSVSAQISSAVVRRWMSGLASLANWRARIGSLALGDDLVGPVDRALHALGRRA